MYIKKSEELCFNSFRANRTPLSGGTTQSGLKQLIFTTGLQHYRRSDKAKPAPESHGEKQAGRWSSREHRTAKDAPSLHFIRPSPYSPPSSSPPGFCHSKNAYVYIRITCDLKFFQRNQCLLSASGRATLAGDIARQGRFPVLQRYIENPNLGTAQAPPPPP